MSVRNHEMRNYNPGSSVPDDIYVFVFPIGTGAPYLVSHHRLLKIYRMWSMQYVSWGHQGEERYSFNAHFENQVIVLTYRMLMCGIL